MSASSSISSSEVTAPQAHGDRAGFISDLGFRIAPLLIVPLIHCGLVLLADPFNFFRLPVNLTSEAVRTKYAAPMNPALYRFNKYRVNPNPDIILGDSRMDLLTPELIKEQTGLDIANLAIPGGTLQMTIDAYWLASEWTKLRSVTMGIPFEMYNDFRIGSEIDAVRSINQNPLLYFTNRNVIDASFEAYKTRLGFTLSNEFQLNRLQPQQIWDGTLVHYLNSLRNWTEPVRYRARLREIAEHCRANGTNLRFLIMPQHQDADRLIVQTGLSRQRATFRSELQAIATVIDLSEASELTSDRKRFTDVLHFRPEKDFKIIARLWPRP